MLGTVRGRAPLGWPTTFQGTGLSQACVIGSKTGWATPASLVLTVKVQLGLATCRLNAVWKDSGGIGADLDVHDALLDDMLDMVILVADVAAGKDILGDSAGEMDCLYVCEHDIDTRRVEPLYHETRPTTNTTCFLRVCLENDTFDVT